MPGVVVFPSVTVIFFILFFFLRVQMCEHDELKTFRWRPPRTILSSTHFPVLFPPSLTLSSTNKQGGRRRQAGGTFGVLLTA